MKAILAARVLGLLLSTKESCVLEKSTTPRNFTNKITFVELGRQFIQVNIPVYHLNASPLWGTHLSQKMSRSSTPGRKHVSSAWFYPAGHASQRNRICVAAICTRYSTDVENLRRGNKKVHITIELPMKYKKKGRPSQGIYSFTSAGR